MRETVYTRRVAVVVIKLRRGLTISTSLDRIGHRLAVEFGAAIHQLRYQYGLTTCLDRFVEIQYLCGLFQIGQCPVG